MSRINYSVHTLDNGLRVILHRDPSIPRVVLNLTYRVGARDEDPSRTGFAHLFEHLMFGGSKNVPEFDRVLQMAGGENNAFTTNDITNYYITVPSSQLEIAMWVESDRMLELDISQKTLDVQKSVVIEEFRQRYLNRPYGDAHHILRDIHFTTHPYRWPTIGKEIAHIEGADLDHVREFYYGFYAPNNATLVIAGNFDTDETLRMAEKWFGSIPSRTLKKHVLPAEPAQLQARSKTVHRDVPHTAVFKMYHIQERNHADYPATDMVTDLLSAGKASRLYNALVKEQELCSSVRAFSWGAHDPGMISIDATLHRGRSTEEYEAALEKVLWGMQDLDEHELQRNKNAIEAGHVMGDVAVLNRAMSLGIYDSLGDPERANTSLDEFLRLSVNEVRAAATRYLNPSNCSTLYYLPENPA